MLLVNFARAVALVGAFYISAWLVGFFGVPHPLAFVLALTMGLWLGDISEQRLVDHFNKDEQQA